MSAPCRKACVVGSGSWGTAFTGLVAPHVDEVALWCRSEEVALGIAETGRNPRHLTGYELAANVHATSDAASALDGAGLVVLALPSAHLRATCSRIAGSVPEGATVVVLTKGMEPGTHKLMLDVAADELGGAGRMAGLCGRGRRFAAGRAGNPACAG